MTKMKVLCPGCGVELITEINSLDNIFNASSACRNLYYQLSFYTLALQDKEFIHQLIVDAYVAQHYGREVKLVAISFGLIGLFLVNECGFTGHEVQQAHIELAKKSKNWPEFSIPHQKALITVKDVLEETDANKQDMIRKWSASVWEMWKPEQPKIEVLLKEYSINYT